MNTVGEIKTKKDLASEYLKNIQWFARNYSKEEYIEALCSEGTMHKKLKVSSAALSSLHKRLFPGKNPKVRPITHILATYNYKYCYKCTYCLDYENFNYNANRADNKTDECKKCLAEYISDNRNSYNYYQANRRADKIKATPLWGQKGIKEFYENCPEGYEVDHILPLKGINICGLHTINNLQYLTVRDNRSKGNKV